MNDDLIYTLVDDVIDKANIARDKLNDPDSSSNLLYDIDQLLDDVVRISKNIESILEQ
jgi:hypothetical protein